jgi:chromosome segregation ATPase
VREYEGHKETLTKLETETKQLQAMIKELEGDFNVLKSERDQVYGIMTEIRGKRDAAEKVVKDMEEELGAMIKERTEIEQKLDAAREAVNEELRDYKENRNLGLQVGRGAVGV